MSPETVRYLLSLDLKMLELTSQTEQAAFPQCINSIQPGGFRIGRVGRAYPDQCEVKLINQDQARAADLSSSSHLTVDWGRGVVVKEQGGLHGLPQQRAEDSRDH